MKMKSTKQKCKRLVYKNTSREYDPSPCILMGVILSEDDGFIKFQTGRKQYTISKSVIISIEDTDIDFREENNEHCN